MEEYDKLVEQNQSGEIDDLDFLLAQDDLADLYVADMQAKGITPSKENASAWLLEYENNNLYLDEVAKLELQKKKEQEEQKEESKPVEELSPAFKLAVAAALAGSFKELSRLKQQGFIPTPKEIDMLKNLDKKVCVTAASILQIKPEAAITVPGTNKGNEVKQLTFNF